MAEFQKVMKQAKRMCDAQEDCEVCPLGKKLDCVCVLSDAAMMMDADKIERIVMDWAEKHPEPRCPTWAEWLKMLGVEKLSDIIPADIAEKLGVKPIEVKNDA